jgi:hypothetical protein
VTELWFEQLEPDECIHLRLRDRHRYDPRAAALPGAVAPGAASTWRLSPNGVCHSEEVSVILLPLHKGVQPHSLKRTNPAAVDRAG